MEAKTNVRREKSEGRENDIIFSKTVSAGKRIYYLDVKQNRKGELFLVITESKKVLTDDGIKPVFFEKHKIFLYKEDFDKFVDAMTDTISYIKENNTVTFVPQDENTVTIEDVL